MCKAKLYNSKNRFIVDMPRNEAMKIARFSGWSFTKWIEYLLEWEEGEYVLITWK